MNDFAKYQTELKNILDDSIQHHLEYIDKENDYYILTLYNGTIFNGKVILNKRPYYADNRYHPTYDVEVLPKPSESGIALKHIHKPEHVKRAIMPYHKFSRNIYHMFLCDNNTLSNSEMCSCIPSNNNVVIPFQNNACDFIKDRFFTNYNVITNKTFTFDHLTIVNSGRVTYTDNLSKLEKQIDKLKRLILRKSSNSIRKLFVYRTKGGRLINNIAQVCDKLSNKGFTIMSDIELASLSVRDQAGLFSKLNEYISIHDASLYNIIYCKPKTKITVLEPIKSLHEKNEDAFEKVCKILNLNYNPIYIDGDKSWRDSSYYLNCSMWS